MIVVKVGGSAGIDYDAVCADLAARWKAGERLILVHGGSGETNRVAEALGHPPRFVTSPSGYTSRFTDRETLEIFEMVYCGLQNKGIVFQNSFADIEHILTTCAEGGTRFEFECYDTAHLYNLKYFLDQGLVRPPLFIQTVFGLQGGIGAHPDDVMHMKRTADRLFGDAYRWSVLGAGRQQMAVAAMAAAMGGHVRVGLEDSLWIGPGQLARSNAEQVRKVRQIIEGLGLEVATPDEARGMLALKGGDKVAF